LAILAGGIVKSPANLLSMLALLSFASLPPTAADSEEPERAAAPSAIEVADEPVAPPPAQRPASIMGELIFDHDMHVDEQELECDECHHETNARPLDYPHADYFHDLWIDCGTCHRPAGSPDLEPQSCYDCHDTRLRDIADERLSPKVILHKNCWKCHEVETGAEASESCKLCHSK
jgi:hypothetical protein